MKKTIIMSGIFIALSTSPAAALTLDIFNTSTETGKIESWKSSLNGQVKVLEDFESNKLGWYPSLDTAVGTFTAAGFAGTGATSYSQNGGSTDDGPHFSIQNSKPWYGRANNTESGSKWLDSGDITKLTLADIDQSLTNLFFYLQDPSDVNATTTIEATDGTSATEEKLYSKLGNGTSYFVGITLDLNETLAQLSWTTTTAGDGYGLDDFSTVAPVPEPTTMLLFGTGLAGLASFRARRKMKK